MKSEKKNKIKIDINGVKKFCKDNKKAIMVGIGVLLIVFLVIGGVSLFSKKGKDNTQKLLENRLRELAKEFYEVKYYPNLINQTTNEVMNDEEKKSFVERFKETGITIDLDSLARLFGEKKEAILEEFKNEDKACNYENTKIMIKPKEPYGITSYDIEVSLDCGFTEKK